MFDFCPHCGQTIEQDQVAGRMLVCGICGKDIGFVGAVQRAAGDEVEARIQTGSATRCPICQQAVELKTSAAGKSLVPHYGTATPRKICPGSGKPARVETPTPAGKDLGKWMTRDVLKVLYAPKNAEPRIEVLTLEYLDKSERVRIQIEALREILGGDFRLCDYPAGLQKPHLAVWTSSEACVIGKRHERGGFESLSDADVLAVLADLRQHRTLFS